MLAAAANDLAVMSDSDIRVTPDFLRTVSAEFQDPETGLATCPYRAVTSSSLWSHLEATAMHTDFSGSALVARTEEGMRFTVGLAIVGRGRARVALGGVRRLK